MTPESIADTKRLTPAAAAEVLSRGWDRIIQSHTSLFVQMQLILVEVERRELWRYVVAEVSSDTTRFCASLDEWICQGSGTGRKTAYDALACARALSHIPPEEREKIPRCNQKTMSKLSTEVSSRPDVRKAAKEESESAFTQKIVKEHPDQHILSKLPMRFKPDTDQREDIDRALELARMIDGAVTREEQLQVIAVFYCENQENKQLLKQLEKEATIH